MQPELDELLSGLRHLRRRASRADLNWIEARYRDGRLTWLRDLLPSGGYERFGRDLVLTDSDAVRRALESIDDTTVGARLGLHVTPTVKVGGSPSRSASPNSLTAAQPRSGLQAAPTRIRSPRRRTRRVGMCGSVPTRKTTIQNCSLI